MRKVTKHIFGGTQIVCPPTEAGESLEEMIRRALANNEPIEATAPMIYTEKAKGVLPETDVRTDRFDMALDATDKFTKQQRAESQEPVAVEEPKTTELEV